jgi:hypothetical protein
LNEGMSGFSEHSDLMDEIELPGRSYTKY